MIEFVTLTGEIIKGQVGCSSYGRNFFARPMFGTVFQSIPSQAWLTKYSKQFFGVVAYENQKDNHSYDRPLFLGVVPINTDKYQGANVEDKHKIQTAKFLVTIDDAAGQLSITSANTAITIDDNTGLITVKNNQTSLKKVLLNILKTYIKTKTIDAKPLDMPSINNALDNIEEVNKIFG